MATVTTGGQAVDAGVKAIRFMRESDCDFLTVANVQDYAGGISEDAARCALVREMGLGWYAQQRAPTTCSLTEALAAQGYDTVPGQSSVQAPDGRTFAVVEGRRWTRVSEYLNNGQLTARWFVDEASGEAREADGWRKPKRWPMASGAQEFARWIVALARM